MPKLDSSISEEANVRVTRSSRRAGSVDLDIDPNTQRTPLKSQILETISEISSVDSITPRRTTRRSIAPIDLGTPKKKSLLTKDNLARLENLNDSSDNAPPSASKRTLRRSSINSEDITKAPATVPFIRLVRTKLATKVEEKIIENSPKNVRGRFSTSEKNQNVTPIKIDDKIETSNYNTRRSASKSPLVDIKDIKIEAQKSPEKPVSSPKPSNVDTIIVTDKLDKTPLKNLRTQALINKTSTPNITPNTKETSSTSNQTVEIITCSDVDESDHDDNNEEPLVEYYRNTRLQKFTGTIQNHVIQDDSGVETNLTEEITKLNEPKNQSLKENKSLKAVNSATKLSLNNLSHSANNCEEVSNVKTSNLSLSRTQEMENTEKPETNKMTEVESESVIEVENEDMETSDQQIICATPIKEIVKISNTSRKLTPKQIIVATPTKKATPVKFETPAKPSTPVKQVSPAKQMTPLIKQATPAKSATPLKPETPIKPVTPLKSATPQKIESPAKTKITTEFNKSINKSLDSNNIAESTITSHIVTTADGSKVLHIHEDDVSIKISLDQNTENDSKINKSTERSFSSSDDPENVDHKTAADSEADTFENFTDNLCRTKAKSCSPQLSKKNSLQSQIMRSSFQGAHNLKNDSNVSESLSNVSKIPSGIFLAADNYIRNETNIEPAKLDSSANNRLTYIVGATSKKSYGGEFVETNNHDNDSVSEDLSKADTSLSKKQKRRNSSVAEKLVSLNVTGSGSFAEVDNHEILPSELSSAKKPKRRSSIFISSGSARGSFIESDNDGPVKESVESKTNGFEDFVTKRKNKSPIKPHKYDEYNDYDQSMDELNVSTTIPSINSSAAESFVESNNVSLGLADTSAGAFLVTDNDPIGNKSHDKLNSSKTKKSKVKTPSKVIAEKREISMEEIQARCNKILEERELARQMLRNQFARKKEKKPKKKIELEDTTVTESIEESPVRSAEKSKSMSKPSSANSSQTKLDITGGSTESSKGKNKNKRKAPESNASPKPQQADIQTTQQISKPSSANSSQTKLDITGGSTESSKGKNKNKRKATESNASPKPQQADIQTTQQISKPSSANSSQTKLDITGGSTESSKGKNKNKRKATESNASPKPQQAENTTTLQIYKPSSANSSQTKLDITGGSTESSKAKNKNKRKAPESASPQPQEAEIKATQQISKLSSEGSTDLSKAKNKNKRKFTEKYSSLEPQQADIQTTQQKLKKVKLDTADKVASKLNRRLPENIVNQLEEKENPPPVKTVQNIPKQSNTLLEVPSILSASAKRRLPDDIINQLDDTPISSQPLKKQKLSKFIEKEKTPEIRPGGFKVSPITPKILANNFRVTNIPKTKMPKKKLKFTDPIKVLPQPVWTSAGVFKEYSADLGQKNRKDIEHHSTTNFVVEDIGVGNSNRGYGQIDKNRRADLNEFKKKILFRSNVPRANATHVLKSNQFQKGNIKLISK